MVGAVSSPFDRELQHLADDERRAENARARIQRLDRTVVAGLSATFLGTLVELAETGGVVTVLTRTESAIRGTVAAVGTDVVVIRSEKSSSDVIIRIAAIEGLLESGAGHDRSIYEIDAGPNLSELLDTLCERGERVAVTMASKNQVMGLMTRVGADQMSLSLDGRGDTMTIPLSAVDQVVRSL